jgi:hypothetical protein
MTEDETWQELERKQQMTKAHTLEEKAQYKSLQFVAEFNGEQLGTMTLRNVYEIGYRAAVLDEQRSKSV